MAHKVFAVAQAKDPVSFDLEGVKFYCRPRMAAGVILAIGANSEDESESSIKTIRMFFATALEPDSLDLFNEMINDPNKAIPLSTLMEIINWLSEVYTARPTGETSESTSQATSDGSNSTDGASPEVLTYSRSTQPALSQ